MGSRKRFLKFRAANLRRGGNILGLVYLDRGGRIASRVLFFSELPGYNSEKHMSLPTTTIGETLVLVALAIKNHKSDGDNTEHT